MGREVEKGPNLPEEKPVWGRLLRGFLTSTRITERKLILLRNPQVYLSLEKGFTKPKAKGITIQGFLGGSDRLNKRKILWAFGGRLLENEKIPRVTKRKEPERASTFAGEVQDRPEKEPGGGVFDTLKISDFDRNPVKTCSETSFFYRDSHKGSSPLSGKTAGLPNFCRDIGFLGRLKRGKNHPTGHGQRERAKSVPGSRKKRSFVGREGALGVLFYRYEFPVWETRRGKAPWLRAS